MGKSVGRRPRTLQMNGTDTRRGKRKRKSGPRRTNKRRKTTKATEKTEEKAEALDFVLHFVFLFSLTSKLPSIHLVHDRMGKKTLLLIFKYVEILYLLTLYFD